MIPPRDFWVLGSFGAGGVGAATRRSHVSPSSHGAAPECESSGWCGNRVLALPRCADLSGGRPPLGRSPLPLALALFVGKHFLLVGNLQLFACNLMVVLAFVCLREKGATYTHFEREAKSFPLLGNR